MKRKRGAVTREEVELRLGMRSARRACSVVEGQDPEHNLGELHP